MSETTRREFLRRTGRWAAAGAAAAGTGLLLWRRQITCRLGGCDGCGELQGCTLDQAQRYRRQQPRRTPRHPNSASQRKARRS